MMKAARTHSLMKPRPGISVRTHAQASGTAKTADNSAVPSPITKTPTIPATAIPSCQVSTSTNKAPEQGRMAGYGSYDAMVDVLEKAAGAHDYIAGNRFTAADVYVGSQVLWGLEFGTLPKRAGFEAYATRLSARPAYQSAKAIDGALIAGAQKG